MPTAERSRRLPPAERRSGILAAARASVAALGPADFSLEDVAARAGVASSLPRHYFGSRDGLLIAVTEQVVGEVLAVLGAPRKFGGLAPRLEGYLDILEHDPWAHEVWMRGARAHPELTRIVARARRYLAEFSFATAWEDMSTDTRIAASGWAGYFESVVSNWLDEGMPDREPVIRVLVDAGRRLGVNGV
jgi:AcrR family transcriptional regulator